MKMPVMSKSIMGLQIIGKTSLESGGFQSTVCPSVTVVDDSLNRSLQEDDVSVWSMN